jgi:hypothetical protein
LLNCYVTAMVGKRAYVIVGANPDPADAAHTRQQRHRLRRAVGKNRVFSIDTSQ